jgi:subtilisin family serine protease
MSELKKYTVTTEGIEDTDSVWEDLTTEGSSVETIPNRVVEVSNERAINPRNTEYLLTEEEAQKLKDDPRVQDVINLEELVPVKFAFQDGAFNKTSTSSGEKQNWGLLRHTSTTNVFGISTADPGGTYDYVLDGTGVDVVIIDSGIQADHPEFQDANGISRVKEINWFTASGVTGTMPTAHYTDYDGHGTHVAGTVAGKTFGWAKNADIYSIKLSGLQGTFDPNGGISSSDAFDCILGWHNAKANGRPTIINNSWGYNIFWDTSLNVMTFNQVTTYAITGGSYRSAPWVGSTRDTGKGHTGDLVSANLYAFEYRVPSVDADVDLLIAAGVIVCNAAGNKGIKSDISGGLDYDNYITANTIGNFYYHRGSSPNCGSGNGFDVGSMGLAFNSTTEARSSFSVCGPGVDVYAAGENVISAMSTSNEHGASTSNYYLNASYRQAVIGGTSMASPQVAGICALLKQAHPDWNPDQIKRWILANSQSILYTTGLSNDYTSTLSVQGGDVKIVYMPMKGQKRYTISG